MERWGRFKYFPMLPIGKDGHMVTGSKEHIQLSRQAAGEGMVLLKNENHTLPLSDGHTIALFGRGCIDYVKGGGGSGDTTVAYTMNFCEAMAEKEKDGRVKVFRPLCDFYCNNVATQKEEAENLQPGQTTEPDVPEELFDAAVEACDVAIISICRFSYENADRTGEPCDGDFYLSGQEQKLVDEVLTRFKNTIVVLNVGGMVDTTWFYDEPRITAVLLAWQGGMEGAGAQTDILFGDVNPSGKLTDTFAKSFDDYPSSYNFHESEDYVCYTEDVFVGYRYFETIPGAAERVNYPFGYGLSYTEFSIESRKVWEENEVLHMEIAVTNIGTVAGKEVVQIYSGAPKCYLEMPKLQLRAFAKTRLLLPGETEVLQLTFAIRDLATYDEKEAAYVFFKGGYEIYVGNCIRSLRSIYTVTCLEDRVVAQCVNRCVPRKLPCRMKADGTFEKLSMSEYEELYPTEEWPEKLPTGNTISVLPNPEGRLPIWDSRDFVQVANGELSLEAFLKSLSDEELLQLVGGTLSRGPADTNGFGGLDYIGIPAVMTADGPAGLRIKPGRGVFTTAWPVGVLLACTWNEDLMYKIGVAGAREVKETNLGIWLTPAINIHRSPLCGRNFEYYAEDPLVAGKMAIAKIKGIQSQNIAACVKHFCVNNKETNRKYSDSRVSERALREIYLKPFELVVKESDVWTVMTAYNLLNGIYTSENQDLLEGILRTEWGFDGLVMTDWSNRAEPYRELLAGNNIRMPIGCPNRLVKAMQEGLLTREDLERNVRKLLELILRLE